MHNQPPKRDSSAIYDVLYGFVPITSWEAEIIDSPFYQRLRWIKQLGFAHYIFPGAEHSRFSHALGVMHSMQQMLEAVGLAVPHKDLHNPKVRDRQTMLHRTLRLAALLHDLGTFPFSHAVEFAYIRHGNDHRRNRQKAKELPNSHEHLGSFIIKNTRFKGGVTEILERHDLSPLDISRAIKGESPDLIANQLTHSDLDADRMDYLLRDAHYTGLRYGEFDRDYILSNLKLYSASNRQVGFGVKESAIPAVDDFLVSRYSWYSQVVKNQDSAKFDIMATFLTEAFLEHNLMYQFHDLLDMVEKGDERFFWWNDPYFLTQCQAIRREGFIKDPQIQECMEMLLFRRAPKTLDHLAFSHQILKSHDIDAQRRKLAHRLKTAVKEIESIFKKHGTGKEWILADIPEKDVQFTKSLRRIKKERKGQNLFDERDPIKVVYNDGRVGLLVDHPHSLMGTLSNQQKYIPSVYANAAGLELLKARKFLR